MMGREIPTTPLQTILPEVKIKVARRGLIMELALLLMASN